MVENNKTLTEQSIEELSVYDVNFPTRFFNSTVVTRLEQTESVLAKIYNAVLSDVSVGSQIRQATKKGFRLVVDATESTLDAIDKGKIKLTTEKSGKTFAQVRKSNGRYGEKLPIKKEVFSKGIDPVQMANSLQMKALQDQIMEITEQIECINYSVQEVLRGQQNDRIGLYYSGAALFLEARNITNSELRQSLLIQALKALSDSTFQLTLKMQSDIKYIVDEEYENAKGKNSRKKLVATRINDINQCFAFIHQATMLKAGTYCEMGELLSMATVLDEYSSFISNTIAPYASLLSQYDKSDTGAEDGLWKSRAKLYLNTSDFTQRLKACETTLYLDVLGDEE